MRKVLLGACGKRWSGESNFNMKLLEIKTQIRPELKVIMDAHNITASDAIEKGIMLLSNQINIEYDEQQSKAIQKLQQHIYTLSDQLHELEKKFRRH